MTNWKEAFTDTTARRRAAEGHISTYNYLKNTGRAKSDIRDVYGDYSAAKGRAMRYVLDLYYAVGGYESPVILGHNCMTFSVGFKFADKETGKRYFAFITRDYNSFCELD